MCRLADLQIFRSRHQHSCARCFDGACQESPERHTFQEGRSVIVYYYGAVLPRRRPHHVLILSVCLSICLFWLEGKRKGLRIPNLVGRVPGTPAPRGPISRSRGQRSRSWRLIALLVKLCYQYGMIIDYVARTYSTARTRHSGRPLNGRTFLFIMCKNCWRYDNCSFTCFHL